MKIVVLDGYTENPGDLSWDAISELGELTVYDRTSYVDAPVIAERIGDAEVVVTNKTPISKETIDECPNMKLIAVLATGYNVVDYFNPRSPCGERRDQGSHPAGNLPISIHAPRVGSDSGCCRSSNGPHDSNPRSPCGERRLHAAGVDELTIFQSTLPVWGATPNGRWQGMQELFQSTLPVWGATRLLCVGHLQREFQSTLPVWGATMVSTDWATPHTFQSTLPVWGATWDSTGAEMASKFQSTLPVWGATLPKSASACGCGFQTNHPLWGAAVTV